MTRSPRALLLLPIALLVALGAAACGTQRIHIPHSDPNYQADFRAAQVFNQRCGGCHTLSYAGTHGSAANPRTAEPINGPNFNVRCERPAIRVLYAIENGGFEGAYMPQNVVVGQQAREVAMFVSRFAGRQAPNEPAPGVKPCVDQPMGTLPVAGSRSRSSSSASPRTVSVGNSLALSAGLALRFSTSKLTAPHPGKVTIKFTVTGALAHNLTVQKGTNGPVLGHTPTFAKSQHTLTLHLAAGTYTYYCSVPGHRAAGMVGTLTVK